MAGSGGAGLYYIFGDTFGQGSHTYTDYGIGGCMISIYATGATSGTVIKSVPRMARIMLMSP
jgi:hypothetical protein